MVPFLLCSLFPVSDDRSRRGPISAEAYARRRRSASLLHRTAAGEPQAWNCKQARSVPARGKLFAFDSQPIQSPVLPREGEKLETFAGMRCLMKES